MVIFASTFQFYLQGVFNTAEVREAGKIFFIFVFVLVCLFVCLLVIREFAIYTYVSGKRIQ